MSKTWLLIWLGFHLLLILIASVRDTFGMFGRVETVLPDAWDSFFLGAEQVGYRAGGSDLGDRNFLRNGLQLYQHASGIEAGYGFFAPNIPANYRVVFRLHYPDGRTEEDIPVVGSEAVGGRLSGLLDYIAEARIEEQRDDMVQSLTKSIWKWHPQADSIETVLASAVLPTADGYARGERTTYEPLTAYTFSFHPK